MTDWKQRLIERKLLISDGAWGTELARHGLPSGTPPEQWNIENPHAVRAVGAAYVEAGSDIILTNTFGGSRYKLTKSGLGGRVEEINRRGARLSVEAAGDRALVFASVGPSGEFMQPVGTVNEQEMTDCFAEQISALADGGAHGIVVETMTDLNEARAAIRAALKVCKLPVVASMTFDKGPKGFATMMGVSPDLAAQELENAGAKIVGANCGAGIADMVKIISAMRKASSLPLWAKSNAGLPQLVDGKTVFREAPEEMSARLADLCGAGANIVGGCCGTTPDHISAFVQKREAIARTQLAEFDPAAELRI